MLTTVAYEVALEPLAKGLLARNSPSSGMLNCAQVGLAAKPLSRSILEITPINVHIHLITRRDSTLEVTLQSISVNQEE